MKANLARTPGGWIWRAWRALPAAAATSIDSAGGIGGLLSVLDTAATTSSGDDVNHVFFCDANGNVGQLLDAASSGSSPTLTARYEYDAYGNIIGPDTDADGDWTDAGSYATVNPWRFSTKQRDDQTPFGYWGQRYLEFATGRWISRDPIGELGGFNLYRALMNQAPAAVDALGTCCKEGAKCSASAEVAFVPMRQADPDSAQAIVYAVAAVELANVFSPGLPGGLEIPGVLESGPGPLEVTGAFARLIKAMKDHNIGSIWMRHKCAVCSPGDRTWTQWWSREDVCTRWKETPFTNWRRCTERVQGVAPIGLPMPDEWLQKVMIKCLESTTQEMESACGSPCQ